MTIEMKPFVQEPFKTTEGWKAIKRIAKDFNHHWSTSESQSELMSRNIPGAKNQIIEEIITPYAEGMGGSQKAGLFAKYKVVNWFRIATFLLRKQGLLSM